MNNNKTKKTNDQLLPVSYIDDEFDYSKLSVPAWLLPLLGEVVPRSYGRLLKGASVLESLAWSWRSDKLDLEFCAWDDPEAGHDFDCTIGDLRRLFTHTCETPPVFTCEEPDCVPF
jgi:hypothetical protein